MSLESNTAIIPQKMSEPPRIQSTLKSGRTPRSFEMFATFSPVQKMKQGKQKLTPDETNKLPGI
jgi:hypothetical protein